MQYWLICLAHPIFTVWCIFDGLKWVHTLFIDAKKQFQVTGLFFADNVNTGFYLLFYRFNPIVEVEDFNKVLQLYGCARYGKADKYFQATLA